MFKATSCHYLRLKKIVINQPFRENICYYLKIGNSGFFRQGSDSCLIINKIIDEQQKKLEKWAAGSGKIVYSNFWLAQKNSRKTSKFV